MAQSAKRRAPDSHMIRPDMTVGSTEEKTNPRKSEMQGPPSAQGSQGLRRCTARLTWPWLPQRDTHALILAHPHSHPGTEATHAGAPGHVTQTKAWHCPRLTLHETAMGQQPVGKLQKSCLPILTVTGTHSQVFPGDLNLQCLGPEYPLMGYPPPPGSLRVQNLSIPRVLLMSDRGHQAAYFRTPCRPPILPCLLSWFPRSSQC